MFAHSLAAPPSIATIPAARISLRRVLLPSEHGSWSFAGEPLLLGLLVAPSASGAALAFAVVAAFFIRPPLKIFFAPQRSRSDRTFALRVLLSLLPLALLGLGSAALLASPARLWPLVLALPGGIVFLNFDLRRDTRASLAEIAGASTFAVVPAALASLAGFSVVSVVSLLVVMLARSLPTILVVRTFLRRRKGEALSAAPALGLTLFSALSLSILAYYDLVPLAAALGASVLFARALWLQSPATSRLGARQIGMIEAILGLTYVLAIGLTWPTPV